MKEESGQPVTDIKGGLTGGYLNKRQMQALHAAFGKLQWTKAAYVQVAILEKLVSDGYLPEMDAEYARQKAEFRIHYPHGNSKRYKDQVKDFLESEKKEEHQVSGRVRTRRERIAARRAARRSQLSS